MAVAMADQHMGEITLEGMYQGAVAAPYGLLFGAVGKARTRSQSAREFADAQNALHDVVEQSETLRRDPDAMREILETLSPVMGTVTGRLKKKPLKPNYLRMKQHGRRILTDLQRNLQA